MTTKHLTPKVLNQRRHEAVRLRLDGHTVAEATRHTGLSAPTVSAAWKAFREGGWEAVNVKARGRRPGQSVVLGETQHRALYTTLAEWPADGAPGWSSRALVTALVNDAEGKASGPAPSQRAIEHWLEHEALKTAPLALEALEKQRSKAGRWYRQQVQPVVSEVLRAGGSLWRGGVVALPRHRYRLHVHGKRDTLYLRCFTEPPRADDYLVLFRRLLDQASDKPVTVIFHGAYFQASPAIGEWLNEHSRFHLLNVPADTL